MFLLQDFLTVRIGRQTTPLFKYMVQQKTRKALVVTGIAVAGFGWWSYGKIKKILQDSIKFSKLVTTETSFKRVSFDLFVNITNPSKIPVRIISQSYIGYINGVPVIKGVSEIEQKIHAHGTSELEMDVTLEPHKLGTELLTQYIAKQAITVKIFVKIKLQIAFFTFNVPYIYETTLKQLLSK